MKKTITAFVLFSISFGLHSQNNCGFDGVYSSFFNTEKEYQQEIEEMNNWYSSYVAGQLSKKAGVDTIDVVFHILHLGEPLGTGSNISDAQIASAIETLNRDYRALPIHDSMAITPYTVDTELHFRLACKDPNQNPTNGIVRINATDSVPNFATYGVFLETTANGGNVEAVANLSKWPESGYVNIWVTHNIKTPSKPSILGAGIPPVNPLYSSGTGGVYMGNEAVGHDYYLTEGYTLSNKGGRLIGHEVGHYFTLLHTFQGGSCTESNCNTQGDGVCDTEPHTNAFFNDYPCDEYAECTTREPVENSMNYGDPDCKNGFTEGQADRIKAALQQYWPNLANKDACPKPTGVNKHSHASNLSIFPNPARENITIQTQHPTANSNYQLYNTMGALLQQGALEGPTTVVPINQQAKGIYFLKVNEQVFQFVKQ